MDDFHNAHLVLDGGGRKGARTPRAVYALLKYGIKPNIVACTSAGIMSGLSLVAAQHAAGPDLDRVADIFYHNAMALWHAFAIMPVGIPAPEMNHVFAAACWQVADNAACMARATRQWMLFGQLFSEPHVMAPVVRAHLPNIDMALKNRHAAMLIANRVDLESGREELIDSRDSATCLEDLLDTANIPYLLPARGGKIDGALGGYNGPLHALPDDGVPRLRVHLPKPKFADYKKLFAHHPALRDCAHRADQMPPQTSQGRAPYLEIAFEHDDSPSDALPTRDYIAKVDAEAEAKLQAVIRNGELDALFAGRPRQRPGRTNALAA